VAIISATGWAEGQADGLVLAQLEGVDHLVAVQARQLIARLLADGDDLHVLAVGDQAVDPLARGADDIGRETARQTLVRRRHHDQVTLVLTGAGQQPGRIGARDAGGQIGDDRGHLARIGPGALGLVLGAFQLGRGDHLHGLRDLLRGFHASDPIAHFLEAGHPALLFL
jgi:hypothetical protein